MHINWNIILKRDWLNLCQILILAVIAVSNIFWLCPTLKHLWQTLFRFFSDILGTSISIMAISCIESCHVNLNPCSKNMTVFATLLARRLKQKERFPPIFAVYGFLYIWDLMHRLTLEKKWVLLQHSVHQLNTIWQPVFHQMEKMDLPAFSSF